MCHLKRLALRIVYTVAYFSGILNLLIYFSKRPIVITYHNVIEDRLYDKTVHLTLTHKASVFDRQISIIKKTFSIANSLEPGKVLITFDDGYRNNLSIALPIMQKHGVKGTFFIPASYFDNAGILWIDRILMWLAHAPPGEFEVLGQCISTRTRTNRDDALESLLQSLVKNYENKDMLLDALEKAYGFASLEIDGELQAQRFEVLNDEEILVLNDAGCRTACHSYKHDILSLLTESQLNADFQQCHEHRARYNSDWYGYPFGRPEEVDARVVEKCREFGFSKAFLNRDTKSDDPFQFPRINMPETSDKILIYAKLSGFERLLKSVFGR